MVPCSLCAAPVDPGATACPRCGIAVRRAAPRRAPGVSRLASVAVALVALGALGATAGPAVSWWRSAAGCEPTGWVEWHVAMKRACVTPAYVCEHMTSAKLLEDPEVAESYRSALVGGDRAALSHLDALVGQLRASYGCEPAASRAAPPAHPRLPPGHPPIGGGAPGPSSSPLFEPPAVLEI